MHEVAGSLPRRHPGVHKADQVGERVIAEDEIHPRLALLILVRRIQTLGLFDTELARPVTRKELAQAAAEQWIAILTGHVPPRLINPEVEFLRYRRRLEIAGGATALLFLLLFARFVWLQIIQHDGKGGLKFTERPFVVMRDHAYVDLGKFQ